MTMASKLLGVVGIFMMAYYAAVNGRCLKPPTGGIPRCPPTWSQWRDKCYKVHDDYVTLEEGKQICIQSSGVIVVPQSKRELKHLCNLFSCGNFWIGCNDIDVEGTWVCLDGEGTIDEQDKRWADGGPNNYNGNQDCAVGGTSGWYDEGCDGIRKLICQRL